MGIKQRRTKLKELRKEMKEEYYKHIVNGLSEEETILFESGKLRNITAEKLKKKWVTIGYISFFAGLLTMILFMTVPKWNEIRTTGTLIFSIMIFSLIIGSVLCLPLLRRWLRNIEGNFQNFLITDKKIYIHTYHKAYMDDYTNTLELKKIIGIVFQKRKWDEKGDYGTINIIYKSVEVEIYTIKNIPDLRQFQIFIESILYEFGNIKERWQSIKNKINFPFTFRISSRHLNNVEQRKKRLTIYIFLFPTFLILITIAILVFYNFDRVYKEQIYVLWILIMAPVLAIMIPIMLYLDKRKMMKRCCSLNSILVFKKDKIVFIRENTKLKIRIDRNIIINYIKINKPLNSYIEWEENIDGIQIKSVYDSMEEIIFGPFDEFPKCFEYFYIYFIIWKSQNSILKLKEQILNQKIEKIQEFPEDKIRKKVIDEDKKNLKDSKQFEIKPLDRSQEKFNTFQNYLNPDEDLLLYYKPEFKLTNIYLKISIGAIGSFISIILVIIFYYIPPYGIFLSIIFLILFMVFLGFIFLPLLFISGKIIMKNSQFLFTTQKIIAKFSKNYLFMTYPNIFSIEKGGIRINTYEILIYSKKTIENSPFIIDRNIHIPRVPNDDNLIDKIRYLNKIYNIELNNFNKVD